MSRTVVGSPDLVELILEPLLPHASLAAQADFARLALVHRAWTEAVSRLLSRVPILGSNETLLGFEEHLRTRSNLPTPSSSLSPSRRWEDLGVPAATAVRSLSIDFAQPKHPPRPGSPLLSKHSVQTRTLKELYLDPRLVTSLSSLSSLSLGHVRLRVSVLCFLLETVSPTLKHLSLDEVDFIDACSWEPTPQVRRSLGEAVLDGLPRLESLKLAGILASVSFVRALQLRAMRPRRVETEDATSKDGPSAPVRKQLALKRLTLIEEAAGFRLRGDGGFPSALEFLCTLAPEWISFTPPGLFHSLWPHPEMLVAAHQIQVISIVARNDDDWPGGMLRELSRMSGIRFEVSTL